MKRHPALQDLSREHHTALVLARRIGACVDAADASARTAMCAQVAAHFAAEMAPHFRIEETTLVPLLRADHDAAAARILADHAMLRALASRIAGADTDALQSFGTVLAEHVRFEERSLFPLLESLFAPGGQAAPVFATS
ncbi:MAG: hemerythrin domain-containing protein [Burkholderiaceae bacterium]